MGASPVVLEVSQYTHSNKFINNLANKRSPNLKAQRYGQIFLSEFIATTILLFTVCLGCMQTSNSPLSPLQSPLTSGFAVAALVASFGHISDAHMNPAVTACFLSLGKIDIAASIVYLVAEILGAITGVGLLRALVPWNILMMNPGLCETNVHPEMSYISAMFFEFIITGLLAYLVCALTDVRNSARQDCTPIKFGLAIAGLSFAGLLQGKQVNEELFKSRYVLPAMGMACCGVSLPIGYCRYRTVRSMFRGALTGASLNPARTFGPAIWNGSWAGHWVYWAGPMAAGFLIPKIYKFLFEKDLAKLINQ